MILILVPLKKELEALVSVLNGVQKNDHGYTYQDYQLVLAGMGKAKFAESTKKYISLLKPDEVIAVGSCGSLVEEIECLDVVFVDKVIEHDIESMPKYICESKRFPELQRAVCASGDQSIIKTADREGLVKRTSADVVTWESAGFFEEMSSNDIPFCELRVVTDLAGDMAESEFKKNLSLGMQKVGMFLKGC